MCYITSYTILFEKWRQQNGWARWVRRRREKRKQKAEERRWTMTLRGGVRDGKWQRLPILPSYLTSVLFSEKFASYFIVDDGSMTIILCLHTYIILYYYNIYTNAYNIIKYSHRDMSIYYEYVCVIQVPCIVLYNTEMMEMSI